jgi:predicted dehydrogenase
LFGDIKNIQTKLRSFNHQHLTEFEDSGIVTFEFGNAAMGCLHFSTSVYDKNMESSITIIAENGSVKIGGQYMDKLEYCHIKNYPAPQLPLSGIANHSYFIQNVIQALNNKAAIISTAADGLKVVEMIERIYAAGNINS